MIYGLHCHYSHQMALCNSGNAGSDVLFSGKTAIFVDFSTNGANNHITGDM